MTTSRSAEPALFRVGRIGGGTLAIVVSTVTGVPRSPTYVGIRPDAECQPKLSEPKHGDLLIMTGDIHTTRRFEFSEGNSNKFWEITIQGTEATVRFGHIGTAGQTSAKTFADAAAAEKHAETLIKQKLGKGYREVP
jgi:DNA ligase 1